MSFQTVDYAFFGLCLFLIWGLISINAERGFLHRWRSAFNDVGRDFRGSKLSLVWVSLTIALGR